MRPQLSAAFFSWRHAKDSAALFILLFLTGIPDFLFLWGATIIVSNSGPRRLAALAIINICYIVAIGGDTTTAINLWTKSTHVSLSGAESYLLGCAIRFACVAALAIVTFCLFEYHRRTKYTRVVIFNTVILGALVAVFKSIPSWGLFSEVIKGTALLFAKYFWAIAFSLIALRWVTSSDRWKTFASLSFWTPVTEFHIGAIPRGVGELIASEKTEPIELDRSRRSGLFLVAIGVMLLAVLDRQWQIAYWIGYSRAGLPRSLIDFTLTTAPLPLLWLRIILIGLSIFLRNAASVSIVVGLVRFAGFHIPRALYGIFQSRNFADLFRRIYFYYSETIAYFFYFPIWKNLQRFGFESKSRGAIAQFVAITWGGVFMHALIDLPILLKWDIGKFLTSGLTRLPYLVLLGILSTVSSTFARKNRKASTDPVDRESPRMLLLRSIGLLVVYFLCVGLAGHVYIDVFAPLVSTEDELSLRLIFFQKIFNL